MVWAIELWDEQSEWYGFSSFTSHAEARKSARDLWEKTRRWSGVALRIRLVRREHVSWFRPLPQ